MRNGNSIKPEEDLFQKSLHQEADFYKGVEKYHYKSVKSFFLAFLVMLLISFTGLFLISILIAGAIAAIQQKSSSFIVGAIFVLFMAIVINLIAFKLLRKLAGTFIAEKKEFKTKAILLLIVPICLFVLIFVLILPVIFSMGFTF